MQQVERNTGEQLGRGERKKTTTTRESTTGRENVKVDWRLECGAFEKSIRRGERRLRDTKHHCAEDSKGLRKEEDCE